LWALESFSTAGLINSNSSSSKTLQTRLSRDKNNTHPTLLKTKRKCFKICYQSRKLIRKNQMPLRNQFPRVSKGNLKQLEVSKRMNQRLNPFFFQKCTKRDPGTTF